MAKLEPDHELTRASNILLSEIKAEAGQYAAALFPGGPAGHQAVPADVELDLIRNHWGEPGFRKKLLDRLSPPGPNGLPGNPEGVEEFFRLYNKAVAERGPVAQMPMSENSAADQPDVAGFGPGQTRRLERNLMKEQGPPPVLPPSPGMAPSVPGAVPAAPSPPTALPAPGGPGAGPPVAPPMPPMPAAPPTGGGALPALALLPAGMPPPPMP